jgi:hypothetical protein
MAHLKSPGPSSQEKDLYPSSLTWGHSWISICVFPNWLHLLYKLWHSVDKRETENFSLVLAKTVNKFIFPFLRIMLFFFQCGSQALRPVISSWQKVSVPFHLGLSGGFLQCPYGMAANIPQSKRPNREQSKKPKVLHDASLEATRSHTPPFSYWLSGPVLALCGDCKSVSVRGA